MADFHIHTEETATPEQKAALDRAKAFYGFVANLLAGMAEAPAVADAYMAMTKAAKETSFSPAERHVVWFTINAEHACHYCMAAHTVIAQSESIPAEVIEAARAVAPQPDPRLEALRQFTLEMVRQRGWVGKDTIDTFIGTGFTKAHVLEVVAILSHKVLSNYVNHILETPLDAPFAPHGWTSPVQQAAE